MGFIESPINPNSGSHPQQLFILHEAGEDGCQGGGTEVGRAEGDDGADMLNSNTVLLRRKQVQVCKDLLCVAQTFLVPKPQKKRIHYQMQRHINQHLGSKRNERRPQHNLSDSIIIGSHKPVMCFPQHSQKYPEERGYFLGFSIWWDQSTSQEENGIKQFKEGEHRNWYTDIQLPSVQQQQQKNSWSDNEDQDSPSKHQNPSFLYSHPLIDL